MRLDLVKNDHELIRMDYELIRMDYELIRMDYELIRMKLCVDLDERRTDPDELRAKLGRHEEYRMIKVEIRYK